MPNQSKKNSLYVASTKRAYTPRTRIHVTPTIGDVKALNRKAEALEKDPKTGHLSVPRDELERITRTYGTPVIHRI